MYDNVVSSFRRNQQFSPHVDGLPFSERDWGLIFFIAPTIWLKCSVYNSVCSGRLSNREIELCIVGFYGEMPYVELCIAIADNSNRCEHRNGAIYYHFLLVFIFIHCQSIHIFIRSDSDKRKIRVENMIFIPKHVRM